MIFSNGLPGACIKRANSYSFIPIFFVLLLFILLLASCKTTRSTISLDEAKQVSLQFSDTSFEPPPRSINDVVPKIGEYFSKTNDCVSRPLLSLEEISEYLRDAPPHPDRRSKANELQREAVRELDHGRYSRSIELLNMSIKALSDKNRVGRGNRYAMLSKYYAYAGDLKSANRAFTKALYFYGQSKYHGTWKEFNLNSAKAHIKQLNGDLDGAEKYFRIAEKIGKTIKDGNPEVELIQVDLIENLLLQDRLLEAEALSREILFDYIHYTYRPLRQARKLFILSKTLFKQGRYSEAEYVAKCAISKYVMHGADCSSIFLNFSTQMLAKSLTAQEKWEEAIEQFEAIREGMKNEPDLFKIRFSDDVDWAIALLATGQSAKVLEQLEAGLEHTSKQFGQNHYRTTVIRGLIAVAHAANGDKKTALKCFAEVLPILIEQSNLSGNKTLTRFTKNPHLILIIETYMNLLADIRSTPLETELGFNAVDISFTLADFLRAQSVQVVITAVGVRYATKDSELADIVRLEQDAGKRLDTLYGTLANAVVHQKAVKKPEVIQALKKKIDELNKARLTFVKEIESRFPKYTQLINPVPPSLQNARASLKPEESLLSIYVGHDQSYVWAIPYKGKVEFATVLLCKKEVDTMVARIRSTLEPNAKMLDEIPMFDLDTAYSFYRAFIEPVRQGWKNAKSIIVVPHGSISYLPLSILPTEKTKLPLNKEAVFENYKKVPWLLRNHALTLFPSVSTLVILRSMPQADSAHLPFVGFGDPYFSEQQAKTASIQKEKVQVAHLENLGSYGLRGIKVERIKTEQLDSAELSLLPRLPETAEEIRSLALSMNADLNRDVFTGVKANEHQVKTMDLSRYKVIAFATHGLAPGDLDGLMQPALALSSPKVAGIEGDGLLTMEEVFGLMLNADWVVLSACNTGAGKEEGAEALTGLCRAFFYAGARALLVSNWPVETTSAKAITTDLFSRQAENPNITRSEALRQSMLSLIDGEGYVDQVTGKVVFSYAHPIFWAPFTLVGDGISNAIFPPK